MKTKTLVILSFVLVGCTTYYGHPYKSGSTFKSDEAECKSQSVYKSCNTSPATTQTTCGRDYLGNPQCTSVYNPAKTTCFDQINGDSVKACLYQKGWYETDRKGNRI